MGSLAEVPASSCSAIRACWRRANRAVHGEIIGGSTGSGLSMFVPVCAAARKDRCSLFAGWSVNAGASCDICFRLRDLSTVVSLGLMSCAGGDGLANRCTAGSYSSVKRRCLFDRRSTGATSPVRIPFRLREPCLRLLPRVASFNKGLDTEVSICMIGGSVGTSPTQTHLIDRVDIEMTQDGIARARRTFWRRHRSRWIAGVIEAYADQVDIVIRARCVELLFGNI